MANEIEKMDVTDLYILEASGFVREERGYNALITLLNECVLMSDSLGLKDTKEFTKILDKIGLDYRWFDDGIELMHNSKFKYYFNNIYVQPEPYVSKSTFREYKEGEGWIMTRNSDFLNI